MTSWITAFPSHYSDTQRSSRQEGIFSNYTSLHINLPQETSHKRQNIHQIERVRALPKVYTGSFIQCVRKIFRKNNITYFVIRTRICAYQRVRIGKNSSTGKKYRMGKIVPQAGKSTLELLSLGFLLATMSLGIGNLISRIAAEVKSLNIHPASLYLLHTRG